MAQAGEGAMAARAEAAVFSPPGAVADYLRLLKPRVMSLVVFSGLAGLLIAPGAPHPLLAAVAVLCIAVGAGASGALNMWYERDLDALMSRTRNRPLPAGRLEAPAALGFGAVLATGSVTLMGLALNWVAAGLLALTIAFYVIVYTIWLKRRTPQNIVIGGAAGALPPVIGWAAASGGLALEPLLLFAIVFLWTPPHFWALALYREGDYARAGIPMMPNVAGARSTRWQILGYAVLLVPAAASLWALGLAGPLYGLGAVALSLGFVALAARLVARASDAMAKRVFGFSILYLFALLALVIADHYVFAAA